MKYVDHVMFWTSGWSTLGHAVFGDIAIKCISRHGVLKIVMKYVRLCHVVFGH